MLTRDNFETRLLAASAQALAVAGDYVRDRLPGEIRYRLLLNQSYDRNQCSDEFVYPEDEGVEASLLDNQRVVDLLWRNGTCPVWIDVSVVAISAEWTILELRCAGRYSSNDKRLYYPARETRPFAVKSPAFPIYWARREFGGCSELPAYEKWRLPRLPWAPLRWLLQRTGRLATYMAWSRQRLHHQQPRRVLRTHRPVVKGLGS